jgi:hypothetical protein
MIFLLLLNQLNAGIKWREFSPPWVVGGEQADTTSNV